MNHIKSEKKISAKSCLVVLNRENIISKCHFPNFARLTLKENPAEICKCKKFFQRTPSGRGKRCPQLELAAYENGWQASWSLLNEQ